MPPPITDVRVVDPGESRPEDVTIMDTVCDLVALDTNAVLFMGYPVPESGGWRQGTLQAHLHSRMLLFTLNVYARGRNMEDDQQCRVWDLIQNKYGY